MTNPYQQYKQNSIMNATPGQLIVMMYNGCMKFIKTAEKAIEQKDIEGANNAILRAQDIIDELMSALDRQYDVSDNLYNLYEYINRRLVEANIKKDKAILQEAYNLVVQLRDAWAEVVKVREKPGRNKGV
ncbi:MAG TPA: flagellar export chaperone FliS [Clostridiales bacterium]|nr:flagellar export chaperone FliS [Clostridiales bacterium]